MIWRHFLGGSCKNQGSRRGYKLFLWVIPASWNKAEKEHQDGVHILYSLRAPPQAPKCVLSLKCAPQAEVLGQAKRHPSEKDWRICLSPLHVTCFPFPLPQACVRIYDEHMLSIWEIPVIRPRGVWPSAFTFVGRLWCPRCEGPWLSSQPTPKG